MNRKYKSLGLAYYLWLALFVIIPIGLLVYKSLLSLDGSLTLENYRVYFSYNYLRMTINSFIYALIITGLAVLIAYPFALFLSRSKYKDILMLLVLLPTWINLLLKAYAFIGIFSKSSGLARFLSFIGLFPDGLLFTKTAFILVTLYIELPFMVLPIYRSLEALPREYVIASQDLGASSWTTFKKIIFPLCIDGFITGIQAVFIPSLSLFMITRIIGGGKIITLGTAVEQNYMVTKNWPLGAAIGVVLILIMALIMALTSYVERKVKNE